jgi:hypothetical protein
VQTPGELTLERKSTYDVRFEKDGYLPASSRIGQRSNGMVLGNILIGGLIGLAIDSSSGAAYYLEPEKVSVTLLPVPATVVGPMPDTGKTVSVPEPPAPPSGAYVAPP